MRFYFGPFYEKPDGIGDAGIDKNASLVRAPKTDDDTELLDKLIGDKDIIDLDSKDNKDDKNDDNDDAEDLLLGAGDDDLIVETNNRGLDLKKIKEKYPDFAKTNEYKELRNAYHREQQYTDLFPTIEDAKEAAENNDIFNKLNQDLVVNGDPTSLLTTLKENNPESFKKIIGSFLDVLSKLDKDSYVETISPVVRRLAKQIHNQGQQYLKRNAESPDGQALVATANNILHYAFPDEDIDVDKMDVRSPNNEPSEKEKELTKREQAIAQDKFNNAYKIAVDSVNHNLKKAVLQGLDPDNKFSEFMRDTLVDKIIAEVQQQIDKDIPHVKRMTSLWKRAGGEDYNRESLSRIVAAYLERARPIIPTVRNKFRTIALKGRDNTPNESDDDIKIVNRGRSGRSPANDGKVNIKAVDTKKIDWNKTSNDDIFEGRVKLKG